MVVEPASFDISTTPRQINFSCGIEGFEEDTFSDLSLQVTVKSQCIVTSFTPSLTDALPSLSVYARTANIDLELPFSLVTEPASCTYARTHVYFIDGVETPVGDFPSWLSVDEQLEKFNVNTNDMTYNGDHTIRIDSSLNTLTQSFTATQETVLSIDIDRCKETTIEEDPLLADVTYLANAVETYSLSSIVGKGAVAHLCGPVECHPVDTSSFWADDHASYSLEFEPLP